MKDGRDPGVKLGITGGDGQKGRENGGKAVDNREDDGSYKGGRMGRDGKAERKRI